MHSAQLTVNNAQFEMKWDSSHLHCPLSLVHCLYQPACAMAAPAIRPVVQAA